MIGDTPWFGMFGGLAAGLALFKIDIFGFELGGFELGAIGSLSPSVTMGLLIGSCIGAGIVVELAVRWLRRDRGNEE